MDDGTLSKNEENRLRELFKEAALRDFPNPDRIGCPGQEFFKKLAFNRKSIPLDNLSLTHVARCSPCFKELLELRHQGTTTVVRRRLALLAAGGSLVAGFAYWQLWPFRTSRAPSEYISARLDLKDRSVVRGNDNVLQPPKLDSLHLPRKPILLTMVLPFASEPGNYEVRILREIEKPILTASGQARLESGNTLLNVRLNLANLSKGQYLVGIRRVPLDWTYHPVAIN